MHHWTSWKATGSVRVLCVARYTYSSLHCARVFDIGADRVSVFFIDYGNTTCIERKLIYPIKPEQTVPSPYAIEYKLDGIVEAGELLRKY